MIGASLHGEPSASWHGVADRLSHADLSLIEGDVGAYQHVSFLRAIQVSIEALEKKSPRDKECYLSLAILLEELEAPVEILSALWGLNEFEARRVAKRLVTPHWHSVRRRKEAYDCTTSNWIICASYMSTRKLFPSFLRNAVVVPCLWERFGTVRLTVDWAASSVPR